MPCHAMVCHAGSDHASLLPPTHDLGDAHDQQGGGDTAAQQIGAAWPGGQGALMAHMGNWGAWQGMAQHGMAWQGMALHGRRMGRTAQGRTARCLHDVAHLHCRKGKAWVGQHLSMAAQRGRRRHSAQALGGQALPDSGSWQQHLPAAPPAVRHPVHPQLWTSGPG